MPCFWSYWVDCTTGFGNGYGRWDGVDGLLHTQPGLWSDEHVIFIIIKCTCYQKSLKQLSQQVGWWLTISFPRASA